MVHINGMQIYTVLSWAALFLSDGEEALVYTDVNMHARFGLACRTETNVCPLIF